MQNKIKKKDFNRQGEIKMSDIKSQLMKISHYDTKAEVRLEAYTDTIMFEKADGSNTKNLIAIRFGGYSESIKGMSAAIYDSRTYIKSDKIAFKQSKRITAVKS